MSFIPVPQISAATIVGKMKMTLGEGKIRIPWPRGAARPEDEGGCFGDGALARGLQGRISAASDEILGHSSHDPTGKVLPAGESYRPAAPRYKVQPPQDRYQRSPATAAALQECFVGGDGGLRRSPGSVEFPGPI